MILLDDGRLLSIDFALHAVTQLIEQPVVSIDRLDRAVSGGRIPRETFRRAARTAERIVVFDANGEINQTFAIPQELRNQPFAFFPGTEGAIYFTSKNGRDSPADAAGDKRTQQREIVWATAEGKVTRRDAVTHSSSWPRGGGFSEAATARVVVGAVPAAGYGAAVAFGIKPWLTAQFDDRVTFAQALQQSAGDTWWIVLFDLALGIWLGGLAFRHQRRQAEPDGWFWAGFVLVFGLPGYVGYRLHRSWPYRQPIPAPEPTGWEVFAK